MRIFIDGILQDFPEWITVSSMSGGVNVESEAVNDRPGELYLGESVKAKTLVCSGVVPEVASVDREVSRLHAMLAGKELVVYRSDDSDLFYRCRLVGDIKTSFYNGKKIGRAFSISFNLKALDGFCHGEGEEISLTVGTNQVTNEGNCNTPVSFQINGPKTLSGTLFTVGGKVFSLVDSVSIPSGQQIIVNSSGMFLFGQDVTDRILDESILNPIFLEPGSNTVTASVAASMAFNPRYR